MKKLFTLCLSAVLSLTAMAQRQIQNPGFETWENEGTTSVEPEHWNSFMSGTGSFKSLAAAQQVAKSDDAHSGSASARIYARSVFGVVAQGNLTTGCINMGSTNATDANGNYNYTNEDDAAYHQTFTGLPDAMRVWTKASCANPAGASCTLHTPGYFQDPAGNTITATVIARANTSDIASSDAWQEVIIPFTYEVTDGTRPSYALVTLTTSGTPGQGAASDAMLVDDVEFLYYSELQSITFNSKDIAVTGTTITIDGTYDEALLQLKSNGQGATISTSYNAASKTLAVSIKGEDIAENPTNQHTYTLIFTGADNEEPSPDPEPEPEPSVTDHFGSLVPFGDFEAWKSECGTTKQIGTGGGDYQRPGSEPEGWNGGSYHFNVRLVTNSMRSQVLVEPSTSANGTGKAVKLTNKSDSYWGNSITFPGFVTYGDLWLWSGGGNYKNTDEGVYGGIAYTKRPDAIRGQFKRPAGTTENAHVIAYLWKGTIQGNIGAYDKPSTGTDDLDRAIMGKVDRVGGDGQLIASCDYTFAETKAGEWETITAPLTYVEGQEETVPEKMNIIISAGDYWSRNIQDGNTLEADSIEFLFYSELASATYSGEDIVFDEENHATIAADYSASALALTATGRDAAIETAYNSATRVLTITVKGGNIEENADNYHTYTLQFPFYADLKTATYKGVAITFDEENHAVIDDNYEEAELQLTARDDAATIEKSYNSTTRILTITVKAGDYATNEDNVQTYRIEFLPQEKVIRERSYTDQIQVTVNEGEGELQSATITLQEWNTGYTSLILKNFKMGNASQPIFVGSIVVNDLTLQSDGTFESTRTITILAGDNPADAQWIGPALGEVPVEINGQELTGRDTPDSLHVQIQIDLRDRMNQFVDVLFGKSLIDKKDDGGEENQNSKITLPDHQDYEDDLVVTLNGNKTAPQTTVISVDFHKNNNTLDLMLKDFGLQDGETVLPVGTIYVKGIGYTLRNGIAYATFNKNVTVAIEEGSDPSVVWTGPLLGEIPITLAGKAGVEKLFCTIDINMAGVGIIHVDFGTDADWPIINGGDEEPKEDPILRDVIFHDVLTVRVNGERNAYQEADVQMKVNDDGSINLTLQNFLLELVDGNYAPLGNIELHDIFPVEVKDKDYYMFVANETLLIQDGDDSQKIWIGSQLGEIPVAMSGKISRSRLYCTISTWMESLEQSVYVVFGENFTDGIEEVKSAIGNGQSHEIYNLAGQRMSTLHKGVNIVDGKKVLMK